MDEVELLHWMHVAAACATASAHVAFASLIDGSFARIAAKTVFVEVSPAQHDLLSDANRNACRQYVCLAISSPLSHAGLRTMVCLFRVVSAPYPCGACTG